MNILSFKFQFFERTLLNNTRPMDNNKLETSLASGGSGGVGPVPQAKTSSNGEGCVDKENQANGDPGQMSKQALPSPMDKRKIFSLTSVSPFVRVGNKIEAKRDMVITQDVEVPETSPPSSSRSEGSSTGPKELPSLKPYKMPQGMPPMPKDNLKKWFSLLEQARAERAEALAALDATQRSLDTLKAGFLELQKNHDATVSFKSDLERKHEDLKEEYAEESLRFDGKMYEMRESAQQEKAKSDLLLEKSRKRYSDAVNAWTDKHEILKTRLEEQKKQTSAAIESAKEAKDEVAAREKQAQTDAEIKANKKNLKALQEISKLEKEVSVLKSKLKHASARSKGGRQSHVSDSMAIHAAYETNKRLKEKLAAEVDRSEKLSEANETLEEQVVALTSDNDGFRKEVETLKQFMRKRVNDANKAKEVVSDLLRNARAERASIEKEKEVVAHKFKISMEEIAKMRRDAQTKDRTEKRMGQRQDALVKEVDELKRVIGEMDIRYAAMEEEKKATKTDMDKNAKTIEEITLANKRANDELMSLRRETAASLKEQKYLDGKRKHLDGEVKYMTAQLKDAKTQMKDASRAMKKLQTQLNTERNERREEVAALTAKSEVARSKLAEGLNAKHKTVMRLSQVKQTNHVMQEEIIGLKEALKRTQAVVKDTKASGDRALVNLKKEMAKKMMSEMSLLRDGHTKALHDVENAHNEIERLRKELERTREAYVDREKAYVEERVRREMLQEQQQKAIAAVEYRSLQPNTAKNTQPRHFVQNERVAELAQPVLSPEVPPSPEAPSAHLSRPPLSKSRSFREISSNGSDKEENEKKKPEVPSSTGPQDAILDAQRYIRRRQQQRRMSKS